MAEAARCVPVLDFAICFSTANPLIARAPPAGEQQLRQRILQSVITRTDGIDFRQLVNRFVTAGGQFRHGRPVFDRQFALRRTAAQASLS